MISVFRHFVGFREYPKYAMMQHFYVYKQALKKEAARLVQAGVMHEPEDIYYLSFEELRQVAMTQAARYQHHHAAQSGPRGVREIDPAAGDDLGWRGHQR